MGTAARRPRRTPPGRCRPSSTREDCRRFLMEKGPPPNSLSEFSCPPPVGLGALKGEDLSTANSKISALERWVEEASVEAINAQWRTCGIGREICLDMAAAGCRVIAAARRVGRLESLCAEINGRGPSEGPDPRAVAVQLDVSAGEATVAAAVGSAWVAFGRIDCLVNNAGVRGEFRLGFQIRYAVSEVWKPESGFLFLKIKIHGLQSCCRGGGCVGGGDDAMDGSAPRTVEEVYRDFKGRRAGIVKALTTGTRKRSGRRKMHLQGTRDLNPLHDVITQNDYKDKYYKELSPLGKKYAELLPWGDKVTSESLKFFSPIVIWSKFTPSQSMHEILYSAFMDYFKAWLYLMEKSAEEKDPLQIIRNREAQHRYLTWRAEKDPGYPLLKKLLGESSAKDLVDNFLFNGVDFLGTKTFLDYFPEYGRQDGTISQKRSIVGKSFETRPWDDKGNFISHGFV